MTIYYLYIKTHKITGLKYFGQTKTNPFKYSGSGTDWRKHIARYGRDILTEIVFQTTNKKELTAQGRYYSCLWNVVGAMDNFGNKIWANRIPETGGGGGNIPGHVAYWPSQEQIQQGIETKRKNGTSKNAGSKSAREKAKHTSLARHGTLKTGNDTSRVKMWETKRKNGTDKGYKKKKTEKSDNAWNLRREKGTDSWTITEKVQCPHCGKIGAKCGAMKQKHFDNCKSIPMATVILTK